MRVASAVAGAGFAACVSDYQQGKDDPAYGAPNSLENLRPPGPTSDNVNSTTSGARPGSPTSSSKPKCVASGGTLAATGSCTVSFANDILTAFDKSGCASQSCHGGTTPLNEPRIEPRDSDATWQEFQAFAISNGTAYINPCSTNPKDSALACNLYATGAPGACGKHMPVGSQLAADVIAKVEQWLACGAPKN